MEFKRLSFLCLIQFLREHNIRFRCCTEPNPEDRRSEGIRIAIDAILMFIVFIDLDQTRL